jgi:hypothetical protein
MAGDGEITCSMPKTNTEIPARTMTEIPARRSR